MWGVPLPPIGLFMDDSNRCGVCRCLPLARLWTTPIDVGCAVASHCLVYGRLAQLSIGSPFDKARTNYVIFTWTPSFGCRPVASSICEFVRFSTYPVLHFYVRVVAWLFLNTMSRVVSFLLLFFSFFFPWKNQRNMKKIVIINLRKYFPPFLFLFNLRNFERVHQVWLLWLILSIHPFLWKLGSILS
jgi:hypothetical protein